MAGKADYLENAVLQHFLRGGSAVSQPAGLYVELYTSATALNLETGASGTVVSGGAYARTAITFSAPSAGSTSNSADCLFPVATASWGTIRYFGIFDASSAGNGLYYGQFAADKTIATDDQLKIASGQLVITDD